MIIYRETKQKFCEDVFSNQIDDIILSEYVAKTGRRVGQSEQDSWRNSLNYMDKIVNDYAIPNDSGITIEYNIPGSSQRIDFIITGMDEHNIEHAILIELKQWSDIEITGQDAIVKTHFKHGLKETTHPSYQVWSYAVQLESYNQTVYEEKINLIPCAYLHNYSTNNNKINDPFYSYYIEKAPLFLKEDALKLREFIKKYIKFGDKKNLIYRIDSGKIKPTKSLVDSLDSMLKGNTEFIMIDEQKVVYEKALALINKAKVGKDQVLIVEGGPGTGKSVVAINLLVEMHKKDYTAHYVTKNAAPRDVFESKLSGSMTKSKISNLFKSSGMYIDSGYNMIDVLIVDEAHRLNEKTGIYSKGDNQIKEIINSSKLSIFFIDENQKIHYKDIGEVETIAKYAKELNCDITYLKLNSQFRCNGSDGYLAWLDNVLQINETANYKLDISEYEFKVFDNPALLRDEIYKENLKNNKARMVAGYCWDWKSKTNKDSYDIVFPEFNFYHLWNLTSHGGNWIIHPESVSEIGCIHTCQGLEVDYIAVIIGNDLIVRDGIIITNPNNRSKMDKSLAGYQKHLKINRNQATIKADEIIKNTYRTLMTRGMKGCYIFSEDRETREYFRNLVELVTPQQIKQEIVKITFIQPKKEYETVQIPMFETVGCGELMYADSTVQDMMAVRKDNLFGGSKYFILRTKGDSMNLAGINDGDLVLCRKNYQPEVGSKVVALVGNDATIKIYHREVGNIVLKPQSNNPIHKNMVFTEGDDIRFQGVVVRVLTEEEIVVIEG
jgi:uncharacterized protein